MSQHIEDSPVTFRLAVFGDPIEQSKSPQIHQMFAEQTGLQITYQKIKGEVDSFTDQLAEFFSHEDAMGVNVTMPFKEQAAAWADTRSISVEQASAANTLIKTSSGIIAETTDGKGLVSDLLRNNMHINGKTLLLIGAGGAARGAISALLDENPKHIYITNRSPANAQRLVDIANDKRVSSISEGDCAKQTFDLIINATSLSLQGNVPNIPDAVFNTQPNVYDMVYQSEDTSFVRKAKSLGCNNAIDGLGMLVGQAAESFYLWFGLRPNPEPVLTMLRKELSGS